MTNIPFTILQIAFLLAAGASTEQLSEDESALLHKIAAMNRANYEKVKSFECEYTRRISGPSDGSEPSERKVKGRWVMKGDKAYVWEAWSTGEESTFVRNANMDWSRRKSRGQPGLASIGSTDAGNLRPPMPDPLSMMDDGTARRIDRLDPNSRQVSSVREVEIDGRKLIEVTIHNRGKGADGSPVTFPVKIFHSVSQGYLPVRSECDFVSPPSQGVDIHQSTKAEIVKLDVNGSDLFVPVAYTYNSRFHGNEPLIIEVSILPDTIRINPEVPDDLFVIQIEPGDQVIDADTHKELQGPREAWGKSDAHIDVAYARLSKAIRQPRARHGGKLEKAPRLKFERWFGQRVTASDMKGKVVLLDFWYLGCKQCEEDMPQLQAIYEEYGPKGLVVLALAGSGGDASQFLRRNRCTFPAAIPEYETWENFALEDVPSYFMIDKQGRLAWGPEHRLPDANEIERLLAEEAK